MSEFRIPDVKNDGERKMMALLASIGRVETRLNAEKARVLDEMGRSEIIPDEFNGAKNLHQEPFRKMREKGLAPSVLDAGYNERHHEARSAEDILGRGERKLLENIALSVRGAEARGEDVRAADSEGRARMLFFAARAKAAFSGNPDADAHLTPRQMEIEPGARAETARNLDNKASYFDPYYNKREGGAQMRALYGSERVAVGVGARTGGRDSDYLDLGVRAMARHAGKSPMAEAPRDSEQAVDWLYAKAAKEGHLFGHTSAVSSLELELKSKLEELSAFISKDPDAKKAGRWLGSLQAQNSDNDMGRDLFTLKKGESAKTLPPRGADPIFDGARRFSAREFAEKYPPLPKVEAPEVERVPSKVESNAPVSNPAQADDGGSKAIPTESPSKVFAETAREPGVTKPKAGPKSVFDISLSGASPEPEEAERAKSSLVGDAARDSELSAGLKAKRQEMGLSETRSELTPEQQEWMKKRVNQHYDKLFERQHQRLAALGVSRDIEGSEVKEAPAPEPEESKAQSSQEEHTPHPAAVGAQSAADRIRARMAARGGVPRKPEVGIKR